MSASVPDISDSDLSGSTLGFGDHEMDDVELEHFVRRLGEQIGDSGPHASFLQPEHIDHLNELKCLLSVASPTQVQLRRAVLIAHYLTFRAIADVMMFGQVWFARSGGSEGGRKGADTRRRLRDKVISDAARAWLKLESDHIVTLPKIAKVTGIPLKRLQNIKDSSRRRGRSAIKARADQLRDDHLRKKLSPNSKIPAPK